MQLLENFVFVEFPRFLLYIPLLKSKHMKHTYNVPQGVHGQGKSQGKNIFFKVRELSGNFEICQGILEFKQKSGNFEITSL